MADEEPQVAAAAAGGEDEDITPGYKPPAEKSLDEIKTLDADDESLVKYKQQLLGGGGEGVLDEGGLNVLVKSITLLSEGREIVTKDLTGDLSTLKQNPIVVKEGATYTLRIDFRVQREIVAGLRFSNVTSRKGLKVDKNKYMVGSYGPKSEVQSFTSPSDEAPSGMIARGTYTVKSEFLDDDKNIYLSWEWSLKVAKDWA